MTRFGLQDRPENRGETNVDRRNYPLCSVSSTPLAPTLPRWPLKYKSDGELRGRRPLSASWAGWRVSYHVIELQESRKGRREDSPGGDFSWLTLLELYQLHWPGSFIKPKAWENPLIFLSGKVKYQQIWTSHQLILNMKGASKLLLQEEKTKEVVAEET